MEFIAGYSQIYKAGLNIGMLLAISAGIGGLVIHFTARIFKIVGG